MKTKLFIKTVCQDLVTLWQISQFANTSCSQVHWPWHVHIIIYPRNLYDVQGLWFPRLCFLKLFMVHFEICLGSWSCCRGHSLILDSLFVTDCIYFVQNMLIFNKTYFLPRCCSVPCATDFHTIPENNMSIHILNSNTYFHYMLHLFLQTHLWVRPKITN